MAVSILLVVGFGLQAVGLLLHIIGLATDEWFLNEHVSCGLWQCCVQIGCVSYTKIVATTSNTGTFFHDVLEKIEASEAFAIIGTLVAFVGLGFAGALALLPICGHTVYQKTHLISSGASLIACICILICCIIVAVGIHEEEDLAKNGIDLGYSFALSVVGAVLVLFGGSFVFFGVMKTQE